MFLWQPIPLYNMEDHRLFFVVLFVIYLFMHTCQALYDCPIIPKLNKILFFKFVKFLLRFEVNARLDHLQ